MSDCSTNAFKVPQKPVLNEPPLNIDEIRAGIPNAARMLVDWAYEAGKAEGIEEGFKSGRSFIEKSLGEDGLQAIKDTVAYQEGYEAAAKNPKAWYVLGLKDKHVHIGDKIKYKDETFTVFSINGEWIQPSESDIIISAELCEKIANETTENVIHCCDCDHSRYDAKYCGLHECFDDDDPGIGLVPVKPDGFCAWAEAVD